MALTDPQSITIATVANSLARVSSVENGSSYRKDDGTVKLKITHNPGKTRTRRQARFDFSKITADPFIETVNREVGMSVFIGTDAPNVGFSITEQKDYVAAVVAWLTASSNANLIKLLGGES